ncbi:mitochondrial GTPase 1, partial [Trichogramma pretiosum]|uniref:mitochondrial GTPase 1 n=1 Tax=Trichogramma pretiosum TaxID=7493 RepID=UPI000C719F8A
VASFREVFKVSNKDVLRWFPGHMGKGVKQMEKQLKNVDCIIEVHDSRIPISGRYADFKKTLLGLKPHIFVLNKIDLADKTYMAPALNILRKEGIQNILQTNLKDESCKESKKILPLMQNLIANSDRFNRSEEKDYSVMVIGVPNVGKSSLINRLRSTHLRKSKAAAVGGVAGITRSVMTKIKISEDPLVYLLDTPGILPPNVKDAITGFKLALVGCSQDHLVGPEVIADYLLFWLNKNKRFEYVEKLQLKEPTDDIMEVLIQLAVKEKKVLKRKDVTLGRIVARPDFNSAALSFIRAFRSGELGLYCLDRDILTSDDD